MGDAAHAQTNLSSADEAGQSSQLRRGRGVATVPAPRPADPQARAQVERQNAEAFEDAAAAPQLTAPVALERELSSVAEDAAHVILWPYLALAAWRCWHPRPKLALGVATFAGRLIAKRVPWMRESGGLFEDLAGLAREISEQFGSAAVAAIEARAVAAKAVAEAVGKEAIQ